MYNLTPNLNLTGHNETESEEYFYDYDFNESVSSFDLYELIPVTIVYGFTLILGVVGNVLIIFTIANYRRMRTITNVFLASLASADLLLVLICIPIKFAKLLSFTWDMGEFLCKFVHYIQSVSAICSVLTLTSMSLERYYAILHPIKAKYICTISQAQKVIAGIWFLSFMLATPTIFMKILYPIGREKNHFWCVKDWDNALWWKIYELYYLSLLLLIPTLVMGFTYTSICLKVWQVMQQRASMISRNGKNRCLTESYPMTPVGNSTQSPASSLRKKNVCHPSAEENATVKQVIKLLVVVVLLFHICWTPLLINNVLTAYRILPELNIGYLKPMRITFHLMAYFNSCVNPIVYGFMSRNFRESFFHVLRKCTGERPSRQLSFTQTRTTSVSMARSLSVSTNERHATDLSTSDGRHLNYYS